MHPSVLKHASRLAVLAVTAVCISTPSAIAQLGSGERNENSSGSTGYQGTYQDQGGSYYAAPLAMDFSRFEKTKRSSLPDLEDYSISEDDLLEVTENGVINVNKIPDYRPQREPQAPLGELCCPTGTSYFLGICTSTTSNQVDHMPGTRLSPGGECEGYRPL